jgi:hypothetical protein
MTTLDQSLRHKIERLEAQVGMLSITVDHWQEKAKLAEEKVRQMEEKEAGAYIILKGEIEKLIKEGGKK